MSQQNGSAWVRLLAVVVVVVCIGLPATVRADMMVYDNTTTPLGPVSFSGGELGDEISLAGTARTITLLSIGVQGDRGGTADLQARMYANNGVGGAPGTLLWESALMNDVALSGGNDLIPFSVPNVTVPDTFTWTMRISAGSAGLPRFGPPTVGSSASWAWFGSSASGWNQLSATDFMARVEAVSVIIPAPGAALLGVIGVSMIIAFRRRLTTGCLTTG